MRTIYNILKLVEEKRKEIDRSQAGYLAVPFQKAEIGRLLGTISFLDVPSKNKKGLADKLLELRKEFEFEIEGLSFEEKTIRSVTISRR